MSHRALRKAIQERSFHGAYYLFGDDDFLKDAAVRQLVDGAVDPATRDFNLEVRRGGEIDAETLGSVLGTPPMMADRRVVVIRDVTTLRKDSRAVLDQYLKRPAPDVVLVLTAPAGAKPDKALEKALDDAARSGAVLAVEYPPLSGDKVPKWVVHHATTELKVGITAPAVELLQSAVGDDLPQLAAELDKLASYTNGGEIDEAAVSAVVGVRRGETMGDLLDRIAERDAAGALALVSHVLQQPKTSGVTLVMALSTQTLALAYGRALYDRNGGTGGRGLYDELFNLVRETHPFTGRPWNDAVRTWSRTVDCWPRADLDRALDALLAADCMLKESRVSSDEQIVTTLVLTMCGERSAERGARS